MNRQSVDKIKLFLMGISQRFEENKQYFIEVKTVFYSGLKEYKGVAKLKGDNISYNFMGADYDLDFQGLLQNITQSCLNYDRVEITYSERGTSILIEGDNKNVKTKYIDAAKESPQSTGDIHGATAQILNRNYLVKVGQADNLLREIGILTKDGKVKNDMIRKYNQIDHFVELIEGLIKELPQDKELTIVDCGCGKSYLSFVLNYYIKEVMKRDCYFIGLDYSQGVIDSSSKMAENLGYNNMEFKVTDIASYHSDKKVDIVISLHACDTATDQALALGINNRAQAIIAIPCCHREVLSQYNYSPLAPILKHGIFKARMADILTDGIRSLILEGQGYKTSVVEYISPLETPKNLMIRAIKSSDYNKKAQQEYLEIKEMLGINPSLEKLIL
jgi:SAM-dependent methyltransferase